jgi:hypothetical protein
MSARTVRTILHRNYIVIRVIRYVMVILYGFLARVSRDAYVSRGAY